MPDAPKRRTVAERLNDIRIKEAARLEDKVRKLRAQAIMLEAEANNLRADAGEVKP